MIDDNDFNMANPNLAGEGEGIGNTDPGASSSKPPRPPRAGIYYVQFDFIETDPDKRFEYGTKDNPELDRLTTRLRGSITGIDTLNYGDKLSYPEKAWLNRKLGGAFGYRLTTLPVMGQKGTAWVYDFLKAYGVSVADLRKMLAGGNSWQTSGIPAGITEAITSGQSIRVYCDWEWGGKTESLTNPDTSKPYYIRRSFKKDDPLNLVPSGMKAFELDHESGEYPYECKFNFTQPAEHGDETEEVTLYAELAVQGFKPPRKQ